VRGVVILPEPGVAFGLPLVPDLASASLPFGCFVIRAVLPNLARGRIDRRIRELVRASDQQSPENDP
jgi:hypothetical protein